MNIKKMIIILVVSLIEFVFACKFAEMSHINLFNLSQTYVATNWGFAFISAILSLGSIAGISYVLVRGGISKRIIILVSTAP